MLDSQLYLVFCCLHLVTHLPVLFVHLPDLEDQAV